MLATNKNESVKYFCGELLNREARRIITAETMPVIHVRNKFLGDDGLVETISDWRGNIYRAHINIRIIFTYIFPCDNLVINKT